MNDGFIKVACGSIAVQVGDIEHNYQQIIARIDQAQAQQVNLLVLPELCLSAYSAGDLFYSRLLQEQAQEYLLRLADYTRGLYPVVVVGVPLNYHSKLYNCAAVLFDGQILGIAAKSYLPNYNEFYEMRQFSSALELADTATIDLGRGAIPFGRNLIFQHARLKEYALAIEICEDLWSVAPPSSTLAAGGATIIANPSASNELVGKSDYRRLLLSATSARLLAGYVYANAHMSESTQDVVYSAHHIIAQNGTIFAECPPFAPQDLLTSELDVKLLSAERHKNTSFRPLCGMRYISFAQKMQTTALTRLPQPNPFVPQDSDQLNARARDILDIQSHALAKRLAHTHAATAVIGISGGIDSTLALLVCVRAMKLLERPLTDIVAVTMPCFGTTKRTKTNATVLCEALGVTLYTIDITQAVRQHFSDIGHDETVLNTTYENCQARERTQVLMDMANKTGGLVIGTGDLSELALGWATYNGDHMSMYGVNVSIPKTLARYLIAYEAHRAPAAIAATLNDILATPVSPELLPVDEKGEMTQKTEDLVGPYELHDFFLYHLLRYGSTPAKIYRLAQLAYPTYDPAVILHWLEVFHRRFFSQQFKRSCLPDGPKVGSVSLSPRGDWRMPSDAARSLWQSDIQQLKETLAQNS